MKLKNVLTIPVNDILKQANAGLINLDPLIQRGRRWSRSQQQQLVVATLANHMVPGLIILREVDGGKEVHDGKHRITALKEFMAGAFSITDVEQDLVRVSWDDLTKEQQRTLLSSPLTVQVLSFESEEETVDHFEAVNTAGKRVDKFDMWRARRGTQEFVAEILRLSSDYVWASFHGPLANEKHLLDLVCYGEALDKEPSQLYRATTDFPKTKTRLLYNVFALRKALEMDHLLGKQIATEAFKQAFVFLARKPSTLQQLPAVREGLMMLKGLLESPEGRLITRRKYHTAAEIHRIFVDQLGLFK